METRQRSDRWSDEPILNEDGEPITATIQNSDRELFKILAPGSRSRDPWSYKFLPRDYLLAVAKRGRVAATERLKLLLRKPNSHLRLPDQPETSTRHQIIALDKNGADELRELRINVPHIRPGRLVHDLMECIIAASFEIGTHEVHDVSITPMSEILASSPARTQKMKNPKYLPSRFEGEPVDVLPDWEPFAINTPRGGVFLPGFEADTGTETLWSRTPSARDIRRKFAEYIYIKENGVLKDHYGASTGKILFCTLRESRMESMMALLEEMQPSKTILRDFIFCHMPHPIHQRRLPPTGYMLTQKYARVGHPEFSFV